MVKSKVISIYCEDLDMSIGTVLDPTRANLIIKGDGTIIINSPEERTELVGNIEADISNFLIELGMPAHLCGFRYSKEAIKMILNNPEMVHAVTKTLYPDVAKMFGISPPTKVERAIRKAIEIAWERGHVKLQDQIFKYLSGNVIRTRPSNSEFLFGIAQQIILSR